MFIFVSQSDQKRLPKCINIPAGNYMFKVNNKNTRTMCGAYFTPCSSVYIVDFEHVIAG